MTNRFSTEVFLDPDNLGKSKVLTEANKPAFPSIESDQHEEYIPQFVVQQKPSVLQAQATSTEQVQFVQPS